MVVRLWGECVDLGIGTWACGRWKSRKLSQSEPFKTVPAGATPVEGEAGTAQVPVEGTEDTRGATGDLAAPATVVLTTDRVVTEEEEDTELGATEQDTEEGMEQGDTVVGRTGEDWVWERMAWV